MKQVENCSDIDYHLPKDLRLTCKEICCWFSERGLDHNSEALLAQSSLSCKTKVYRLVILVKIHIAGLHSQKFCFSRFGVGLKNWHSNKFPDDADVADGKIENHWHSRLGGRTVLETRTQISVSTLHPSPETECSYHLAPAHPQWPGFREGAWDREVTVTLQPPINQNWKCLLKNKTNFWVWNFGRFFVVVCLFRCTDVTWVAVCNLKGKTRYIQALKHRVILTSKSLTKFSYKYKDFILYFFSFHYILL